MLLEHLDGYEAAQCIAAGGAVLALSAGGCTAYGVALAFVVFLWLAELALPHHAVKARILSPRGTPRPSSQLRKVLADAEVPEIEEQLAELGAKAPGDVQYLDDADIADLGRRRSRAPASRASRRRRRRNHRPASNNKQRYYNSPWSRAQSQPFRALARCRPKRRGSSISHATSRPGSSGCARARRRQ